MPESLKKLEDMDAVLAQEDVTNWTNEVETPHFLSLHFSKVFKNLTGVSPSKFREQSVGKGE